MHAFESRQQPEMTTADEADRKVDSMAAFARESRRLIGKPVVERAHWNTKVSADGIRHFAWGIGDDNPLWVDSDYATAGPYGRLAAPPPILRCSTPFCTAQCRAFR